MQGQKRDSLFIIGSREKPDYYWKSLLFSRYLMHIYDAKIGNVMVVVVVDDHDIGSFT
jgi:hypothetical protein